MLNAAPSDSEHKLSIHRLDGLELGDAKLRSKWDSFVARSPQANPFAASSWLLNAAPAVGAAVEVWVAAKGDEWIAAVPITHRDRFGARFFLGLPLAAYNSYLYRAATGGHPSRTTTEHLEATQALADGIGRRVLNLNHLLHPSIDDVRPWVWKGWSATPRYTYLLDLTGGLPVTDSVRRHVRKCQESEMHVVWDWDLDRFWSVFSETKDRQGFGLRMDQQHFSRLADALHEAGIAWMATALTARGEPAAGQIMLSIPETPAVFMWTAGARSAYLSTGVSAWLMLEIAAEAHRSRGHVTWDLCGADLPGVARFKSELGGALCPYFEIRPPVSWLERGYARAKIAARSLGRLAGRRS